MNLEQIYFIAEIIAAFAVVISLIYLGVQVKQSRIQRKNEAIDLIAQNRSEFTEVLATDNELSLIVAKGLSGSTKLPPHEYYRFTIYLYSICVNLEIAHNKWQMKALPKEIWEAWDEGSQSWFICPGFQRWWLHNHIGGFTPSFKQYVDNCIKRIQSEENINYDKVINFLKSIETHDELNTSNETESN